MSVAIAAAVQSQSFPGVAGLVDDSELLRFTTAGSVDDGKSTLIGRLLYDTKTAFVDQLQHVEDVSRRRGDERVNLALLTDGLRAEREQGITIDVAYRYFTTARRKFIIADTPGHEQYTRNMATGASTAALAVILIDARRGVLPQSRRHAFIAHLLGIPRLVVAVNKMDLVDYSREIFDAIRAEFSDFTARLGAPEPYYIPVSALRGDNVVSSGTRMPWYDGPTLLRYLEEVPAVVRGAGVGGDVEAAHGPAAGGLQGVQRLAAGEPHVGAVEADPAHVRHAGEGAVLPHDLRRRVGVLGHGVFLTERLGAGEQQRRRESGDGRRDPALRAAAAERPHLANFFRLGTGQARPAPPGRQP
jgi:small GTP-binding protein